MKPGFWIKYRTPSLFTLVLALVTSGIWCARYFVVQDGIAHLYTSYVMGQLIAGDPQFSSVLELNRVVVPNGTGHWLMMCMVPFLTAASVTKIMLIGTLALFAGSVLSLRKGITGDSGGIITLLFAFAIGFNWLWFVGTYNHVIGTAVLLFTLGRFYKWRDAMTPLRGAALGALVTLAYVSHLVAFVLLIGSLLILAVLNSRDRIRGLLSIAIAVIPSVPLLVAFQRLGAAEGSKFVPTWETTVGEPSSVAIWIKQFLFADPFILLSRQTVPFSSVHSEWLLVLSPIVFIFAATTLLVHRGGSTQFARAYLRHPRLPLVLLCAGCFLGAVFGPDHFGMQNGSLLRERLFIVGFAICAVFFRPASSVARKVAAGIMLTIVLAVQGLALWEYGLKSSSEIGPFEAASHSVPAGQRIASVIIWSGEIRFHSEPLAQVTSYVGVASHATVFDDYEYRHYMFPVIAKDLEFRAFVEQLTHSNLFALNDPDDKYSAELSRFEKLLRDDNPRIDLLYVYGSEDRVNRIIDRSFSEVPVFSQGDLRVLRHN